MRRVIFLLPIVLSCLLADSARSASLETLPFLPGGRDSISVSAVSADGTTVVGSESSHLEREAFAYDADQGIRGLGALPSHTIPYSWAYGVSADGTTVVGGSFSQGGGEAFTWNSIEGMRGLGDLPGGAFFSRATAVSADGQTIAGFAGIEPFGTVGAFIWDPIRGMRGLGGRFRGYVSSEATAISGDGSIVVGLAGSAYRTTEAFVWDEVGGLRGLGDLPGGIFHSEARAISFDGTTIVGQASSGDAPGGEAVMWDATGGMRGLGYLPEGYALSHALGVSGDGTVVVGWSQLESGQAAMIWDARHGMRSLADVLSSRGVDLAGSRLYRAKGISADGTTIVGEGRNSDGRSIGFVAVLEPPQEVEIDIDPEDPLNQIDLDLDRKIVVAILGSDTLDAWEIDRTTLAFGPGGAMPANANGKGGYVVDIDRDGHLDLVSYYLIDETGIERGDTEACVSGLLDDGTFFEGCDAIQVD